MKGSFPVVISSYWLNLSHAQMHKCHCKKEEAGQNSLPPFSVAYIQSENQEAVKRGTWKKLLQEELEI